MKRIAYQTLLPVIGAIIFGAYGFWRFSGYGGNQCDVPGKSCDCFCCHMFGLRGYESCGDFGLLVGLAVGAVLGASVYGLLKHRK